MDPLIVLLVTFAFVILVLQAWTVRSVRSASHSGKIDSPIRGTDSPAKGTHSDVATQTLESSPVPNSDHELRPSSELATVKEVCPDPSTRKAECSASEPGWQWRSYVKSAKTGGGFDLTEIKETDADNGPFKIHYLRATTTPSIGHCTEEEVEVVVVSPPLIKILQRYLPDNGDLKSLAEPTLHGRDLYMTLKSLKCHAPKVSVKSWNGEHADNEKTADGQSHAVEVGEFGTERGAEKPLTAANDELGIIHLKHLVRFLEKEYEDTGKRQARMRQEKRVSWDMLWAFLPKGIKVGYYCDISGELLCAVVTGTRYEWRRQDNPGERFVYYRKILKVDLEVYDFNGIQYQDCSVRRDVDIYHMERKFPQLPVFPLEFLGDPFDLEKKFAADGERFFELSTTKPYPYMCYEGSMYRQLRNEYTGHWTLHKQKADGRVMIDLCSFAAMNPVQPMGNARPPSKSKRACTPVGAEVGAQLSKENQDEIPTNTLIFAPAVVYGFSFALKEWGCFAVSRFSDVVFDREAFQDLVMEPSLKSLVHDLVQQYVSPTGSSVESREQVDPIAGKGQGCIVMCYGPPGTGKTLTAESIAESMDRPLWALSVGELGTTPQELEMTLLKVLDIAAMWKAVLLLDEADIYLERRTDRGDVLRNAMTGVFLRQVEYYRGILFLTTNRIGMLDDAFKSRISIFLEYRQLNSTDAATIWGNLLRRAGVDGLSDDIFNDLSNRQLNGRQIRNVIRTAQVWAKAKNQRLGSRHIEYVMKALPPVPSSIPSDETPPAS